MLEILTGSAAFGQLLSFSGVTPAITRLATDTVLDAIVILILMELVVIFLGMFIEQTSIVMVTILWTSPGLWWVAVVPPAVLLTAYRTSISHRIERQRLEKLYEASSLLHKSPQVEDALIAAAEQAQSMFGVTDVEIVVLSDESVSRRHARIHFLHPGLVEIRDLSSNGTFLDGRRIDCVAVTDLDKRAHVLSLGAQERLFIELRNGSADS